MGLRDLLKKRDTIKEGDAPDPATVSRLAAPEFKFIRSDTFSEEVIEPPNAPPSPEPFPSAGGHLAAGDGSAGRPSRLSLDVFGRGSRSRSTSVSSNKSGLSSPVVGSSGEKDKDKKRLSHRLHLHRAPASSEAVPQDLPEIVVPEDGDRYGAESQWEQRATILARENEKHRSRPGTPGTSREPSQTTLAGDMGKMSLGGEKGGAAATTAVDADIQEAIRLHEEGEFEQSTAMFARLADPRGANDPLSQVLYGLALRHGWGTAPDPAGAVNFLSAAASNAAAVENMALQAGLKKGGTAKGELVLAIFELANCFRYGWGIPKDPIAAKQYYETAANLGDTDAMNEVAWCYLEGFGCKKDKFAAAKYYRLAEQNGNKTLGNTWIWKDKYDPGNSKK